MVGEEAGGRWPNCEHDSWEWVEQKDTGVKGGNARNPHPTVKPLALARWLATLLLPPDAYAPRRILVPFAGSGSEAIGAMLAGWEEVVAIEREDEYADIARARLAWWEANRDKAPEVRAAEPYRRERNDERQTPSTSPVYGEFAGTEPRDTPPMLPGFDD